MSILYLHIGYNKTATTSIQEFCKENAAKLNEQGYLYPTCGQTSRGAHHFLASHFMQEPPISWTTKVNWDNYFNEFLRSIDSAQRVILSSEMLSWFSKCNVARLQQLIASFDKVRILMYVRRQDSYAVSFYNSRIRNGSKVPSFPEFCMEESDKLDFYSNLLQWEKFIGRNNLTVRPFVEKIWKDGNVIDDFFNVIDSNLSLREFVRLKQVNPSLPLLAVEILRQTNSLDISQRPQFVNLIRELTSNTEMPSLGGFLTKAIQKQLLESFEKGNRLMAQRYWTDAEARLFFEQSVQSSENNFSGIPNDVLINIIAKLWEHAAHIMNLQGIKLPPTLD